MITTDRTILLGIGSVYVETNYLGLNTGGEDVVRAGKEYRAQTYETKLGGSVLNFVVQAKRLGAEVGLIGKAGKDEAGDKLVSLLKEAGIASDCIARSTDVQTSVDTGMVLSHSGINIQCVAGNANQTLSRADIDLKHPLFDRVAAVYLGGFSKQESLYKDYPKLIDDIKSLGIRVFFDHGRIPVDMTSGKKDALFASVARVDGYFPNESEILEVTGKDTLDAALDEMLNLRVPLIVVKLGEKGCRVKTPTEDFTVPAYNVNVVNTVGAGDAFNAGFLTSYLSGKPLSECAKIANVVAAIRVSENHPPDSKEVREFLDKI